MLFKISFKNQFKALEFIAFILFFSIACVIYFKYTDPSFHIEYFIWFFLIQFIPVLYLHIEYLILNSGAALALDFNLMALRYSSKTETLSLSFDRIVKIVQYMPPSAYRSQLEGKMQFLPIEPYGYAIFYSKDGDKILITSLMIPNLNIELGKIKGVDIERKKRLLASPSLEKAIQWFAKDGCIIK